MLLLILGKRVSAIKDTSIIFSAIEPLSELFISVFAALHFNIYTYYKVRSQRLWFRL